MTKTAMPSPPTTQVYRIFIRATPQAIWDAITSPEWTQRYGYRTPVAYDLRPGGEFSHPSNETMKSYGVPDIAAKGKVIEADPPRKLVQTWQAMWGDPVEPATRLTYEIRDDGAGVSELTVIHDLEGAPNLADMVGGRIEGAGGGWWGMLSDLKTLLETGAPLRG